MADKNCPIVDISFVDNTRSRAEAEVIMQWSKVQ